MRKVLVAPAAAVMPALASGSVAAPKITNNGHRGCAAAGLDIFGLTQRARDLSEQGSQGES